MGVVFDLAVLAFSLLVVASLAGLAWTIGMGGDAAATRARGRVADLRDLVARLQDRLPIIGPGA